MNAAQIAIVQSSWHEVEPIRDVAARLFYSRLFELDPGLKPLFKSDPAAQGDKLMAALRMVVHGLGRLDELLPSVQRLAVRHVGYGAQTAHYTTVGQALLWTLQQGLGQRFTADVRDAWAAAYGLLAGAMTAAAEAHADAAGTPA